MKGNAIINTVLDIGKELKSENEKDEKKYDRKRRSRPNQNFDEVPDRVEDLVILDL